MKLNSYFMILVVVKRNIKLRFFDVGKFEI